MTFEEIRKDVSAGKIASIYYLHGEEPFYIDKLTRLIESSVLNPEEEAFNKYVTYGIEAKAGKLFSELRSFPVMANRRLVVVREAQRMDDSELEKLVTYLENPVPSSVLVISWKGKGVDGRTKVSKLLNKNGVTYESKTVYENKLGDHILKMFQERSATLDDDALHVLTTYIGNNLSLLDNEIEKITLSIPEGSRKHADSKHIFEMINVDREVNVFELLNALGKRDDAKAHFVINQMTKNPKDHPTIFVISQIFRYFNDLARIHAGKIRSQMEAANLTKKPPFIAAQYVDAARRFKPVEIFRNLNHTLEADLYAKGVRSSQMGHDHILKTLVYRLLN